MLKKSVTKAMAGAVVLGVLAAGSAWAATTYYVRSDGSDTYDGTSPTWLGGTVGPKLTYESAYGLTVDGDTVDVGPGSFPIAVTTFYFSKKVLTVGAGPALTSIYLPPGYPNPGYGVNFNFISSVDGTAGAPTLLIKNLTLANAWYGLDVRFRRYIMFENMAFTNFGYNIRMQGGSDAIGLTLKNFVETNFASGGYFTKTESGNPPCTNIDLTIDGGHLDRYGAGTWAHIVWRFGGTTTIKGAFQYTRNPLPFWSGNRDGWSVLTYGTFLVDNATFSDNNSAGIYLGKLQAGANVVIKNATFADTTDGYAQSAGLSATIDSGTAVGNIRFVSCVFTGATTTGISIIDDGSISQTAPIELKNVDFKNCANGLLISGSASTNLWYIDPAQSGATINPGGTLVSGGRKTYYGDANLDGVVNRDDYLHVYPYRWITNDATWGMGDFDFDGDVDAADMARLPPLPPPRIVFSIR